MPAPIGVVSVAGLYRTGKSYLLNRVILDRSDGFGVGPTVNAHTKGIWVWNRYICGQSPEGEKINVLVVDSEGIGNWDESNNHDNRKKQILVNSRRICFDDFIEHLLYI